MSDYELPSPDFIEKAAASYKEWTADGINWKVGVTTYPYLTVSIAGIDNKDFTKEDNDKLVYLLVSQYYGTEERFAKSLMDGSLEVLKTQSGPWFLRDKSMKDGNTTRGQQFLN